METLSAVISGEEEIVLQNISYAILLETPDRHIMFVNQSFCDLFQIPAPPEALKGYDCTNAAEESAHFFLDPQAFKDSIVRILENGKPVLNEEIALADGRYFMRDYKPILMPNKEYGHLWVYKDFSPVKKLENENRKLKDFYEKVLNNIPADIAIFDKDHHYLFVNKTGVGDEQLRNWLIGKNDYDYCDLRNLPYEKADKRSRAFRLSQETRETVEMEEEALNKEGEKVYNLRRFFPYFNEDNINQFVVGYGLNITSLKQKEEEINLVNKNLRSLVNAVDEIILTVDAQHRIVFANPSWQKSMGYKVEDVIGHPLELYIEKQVNPRLFAILDSFFIDKALYKERNLITVKNKEGQKRHLKYIVKPFSNVKNIDTIASVFLTDVTEQIAAVYKLSELVEEEKRLNTMKSSFVNMVSHELRTPLSIIQSGAEIIEMMIDANLNDPASIKEQASRIAQEVTATTAMLNELLLVSKIEAGKIDYKPQETDIALFVLGLLEEYFMPYKDGRMVQLQVKGTPRFGKLDKMIMQHIVINLLDNAFKYSPGAPAPTLRLHFQQNQWTLLLKDNGIGIPAKDMDTLFTAFARASNVGEIHGTGLGLVIIKYMTINHGGCFAIKSKEGVGTFALIGFNYN